MKLKIVAPGEPCNRNTVEAEIAGTVTLSEVFAGISIVTEDDGATGSQRFGIVQRDSGLEIYCPDGAMLEIGITDSGETCVKAYTASCPKWAGQPEDGKQEN
jgi:hypothetical protein